MSYASDRYTSPSIIAGTFPLGLARLNSGFSRSKDLSWTLIGSYGIFFSARASFTSREFPERGKQKSFMWLNPFFRTNGTNNDKAPRHFLRRRQRSQECRDHDKPRRLKPSLAFFQ